MNKNKLKRLLSFLWAFPLMLIWRYTFFIHKYRLIKIRSDRIGHFAPDGAEQIARLKLENNNRKLFCFDQVISNHQWAIMLERKLPVFRFLTYVFFWNEKLYNDYKFTEIGTKTGSRDIYNLYFKTDVKIKFTTNENKKVFKWLEKFGFKAHEKFICLLVRDDEYLKKYFKDKNWDYHTYRNSDIQNYKRGIEWLISKGFWVIRMGKLNSQKLKMNSKKFIDFSFVKEKSDLIDIWLFANCHGCITTGTGTDAISHIYEKPCLGINWLPVMGIQSYHNIISYPKYLYDKNKNLLSIKESIKCNFYSTEDFSMNGITIKDLSPFQIKNAFEEFYKYKLENQNVELVYKEKNKNFWLQVLKFDKSKKIHHEIHKKALISKEWINAHSH